MKLVYCPECFDVFAVSIDLRQCRCGHSVSLFRNFDECDTALFAGKAVPIELDGEGLVNAIRALDLFSKTTSTISEPFSAYVMNQEHAAQLERWVYDESLQA